jgi:RHS repeat-associated protein
MGNGVVTNRAFDAVTAWVSSIQAGVGGGTALLNSAFTYDEVGDVTQRQNNNAGLTENFYYDTDYRLDHSTLNGTLNLQMVYDTTGMGNIASRSDVAGGTAWTYDPVRKHAVTEAGSSSYVYTYDGNGNQITRSGNQVSWTSYNYPTVVSTSSESASFQYGPFRDRYRTVYTGSIGTETTYHVGKLLEKVANAGVVTYRYYIYAGSEPVAVNNVPTSGSATLTYVLEDHQGTPASLATGTGTLDVAESFTAFGNRRNGESWSGAPTTADENAINAVSRQGYTWQTALGVSMGLNHMNGRIEDAVTGRFLSPDPRIPNPGNTQDFNRYSYADNNPLTFTDPSGFDARTCPQDGGCGGAGSGGVQGTPEQNSWDCYGNCGNLGWANSFPSSGGSDPLSLVGQVASIVAQSAADAVSDPSNWTSAGGDMTSASNDANFASDAGSTADSAQSDSSQVVPVALNQGVPVVLPNGQTVPDQFSPTGNLMSPVADLSEVVVTGHVIGDTYSSLLSNPEASGGAIAYLGSAILGAVGQGGTYDYQRKGNRITGFTQYPQFRDVSNFNVGLLTQAAGLTLDETLSYAGDLAYWESSNYSPNQPYGLNPRTAAFITLGYTYGQSGAFGP